MEEKIIIYRESFIQSLLSDISTFGVLVGSFAVNHYFIGSKFLGGFIFIVFLFFVIGKTSARKNTFTDKQKAIDFINK